MIIWMVRHNVENYSALGLEREIRPNPLLRFNGQRLGFNWQPLTVCAEQHHLLPLPDFPYLGAKVLVASSRAVEVLQPMLGDSVEFLELLCEDKQFYAINVLTILDCLDKVRSEFERFEHGGIKRVKRHEFQRDCVKEYRIFKLPETNLASVYINDEIKKLIENNELSGLDFYKVWEG